MCPKFELDHKVNQCYEKFIMKIILFLIAILFLCRPGLCQISISPGISAQELATRLTGPGVTILNPSFGPGCPEAARGKFDYNGNNSIIGIDSGVVLTCGRAEGIVIPYGVNANSANFASTPFAPVFPLAPGDPDLTALINQYTMAGTQTYDACVLEFDFIPSGDTIRFDYVFASEEYNGPHGNFNCTVNDVFGFFISGPGYTGATNIALIPGTNIMVGVSTVNDGVGFTSGGSCDLNTLGNGPYTGYYNSNPGSPHFVYSGFTDVFTATAAVIPCETYHLKLAISDASDNLYDSGVFIKAGSLTTTKVKTNSISGGGQNDSRVHAVRGCVPAKIVFGRPDCDSSMPLTYQLQIDGTAINGVDYTYLPDSFIVPTNRNTDTLQIKALSVPNPSGNPVYVVVGVYDPDSVALGIANPPIISRDTIWIHDSLFAVAFTEPELACPGDTVFISAGTLDVLEYTWSPYGIVNDSNSMDVFVIPESDVEITFTVTQPGAPATCPSVTKTFPIVVQPGLQLHAEDITVCLSDSVDIVVSASPTDENYIWKWEPSEHLRNDYDRINRFYASVGSYTYSVKVVDPSGNRCPRTGELSIQVEPPFELEVYPKDTTINYGDEIQIGFDNEAIYWTWYPKKYLSGDSSKSPYARPLEDMEYHVMGWNRYGCQDSGLVRINLRNNSNIWVPSAFSPNGDGINDVFKVYNLGYAKLIAFNVFNRYGNLIFAGSKHDEGWDGLYQGRAMDVGVYFYYIHLRLPDGKEKILRGDVTLMR